MRRLIYYRVNLLFLICMVFVVVTGSSINNNPNSVYKVEDSVEEYFVEHAISSVQAKEALKQFSSEIEPKSGCQECTRQEIRYCLGPQLMNDHCCCDKRYLEFFPYVPHTCYIGKKLCKPLAKDCAEYTRLRICCCDKYLLDKWKSKSNGSKRNEIFKLLIVLITMQMYYIFINKN